ACDLLLLRCQLAVSGKVAATDLLAAGEQLRAGSFGERLGTSGGEPLIRLMEMLARVGSPIAAAQDLAVQEVRSGQVEAERGATEAVDGLAVVVLRRAALGEDRAAPSLRPRGPVGPLDHDVTQLAQLVVRQVASAGPRRSLDQLR